jgi:hypothetical protein
MNFVGNLRSAATARESWKPKKQAGKHVPIKSKKLKRNQERQAVHSPTIAVYPSFLLKPVSVCRSMSDM